MAKLTRSGVAHDLTISPHKFIVNYEDESLTYVFSSELYMKKFSEKLIAHREKISESLSKRFGFRVEMKKLSDIKLYDTTETRGFLIKGKEDFLCLNSIALSGETMTKKS